MEDEEYIVQGEAQESSGGSNRPFLTAVGILLFVFILAAGCSAYNLFTRDSTNEVALATVAAIETQNAIVAVTNEAVTQTIAAMETEEARPSETPSPPPTFTPSPQPTATTQPTNTPVVADSGTGEGSGDVGTPNVSGTSTFGDSTDASTPTPIPVVVGDGSGSLPDTGFETWGVALVALALVAVLLMARRLRRA
ncbi:MAG: hypothetical protein IPM39_14020 [Chloroflexi bacterium]|nr:hypothetical protein [Chloroflexota bacterium]